MNIGITIDISINPKNSPTNQLIIFIADVLARAGHKCFLVTNKRFNPHRRNSGFDIMRAGHFLARFDPHEKSPIAFDVCIEAGFQYEADVAFELKEKNPHCKFVYLCLEDHYLLDSVMSTTNPPNPPRRLVRQFNQIWTWSHLKRTIPYLEATYGCETKTIPFIWDSKFLNKEVDALSKKRLSPFYNPNKKNVVCILEENNNISSTCLIPLAICEKLNHQHSDLISKVCITNCEKIRDSVRFKDLTSNLSICKVNPPKVFFNNKWQNSHALSRWGKSIITNSIFGDLSVRHLEFLHLEFPLLHNVEAIKDFAYYYNTENIKNAVNQLHYSLTMHDQNLDYYKGQAKECLARFSAINQKNVNAYNVMVKNLSENK